MKKSIGAALTFILMACWAVLTFMVIFSLVFNIAALALSERNPFAWPLGVRFAVGFIGAILGIPPVAFVLWGWYRS